MGSCDEILDLISAALDGPLSQAEQTALDAHLAVCPACSALFQELSALHTAASELEEIPAPEGFAAGVMARISAEAAQEQSDNVIPFPKKARRSHWKQWTASAAVVAVVALGAITLPGQLGGSRVMTADASSAAAPQAATDCATADTADTAAAEVFDGEVAESETFSATTGGTSLYSAQKNTALENAASESSDALAKQEPAPTVRAAAGSYCAMLTLSAQELPDALEEYESFFEDGAQYYLIPAEKFYALAQECAAEIEELDPAGEYGLIRVLEG